MTTSQTTELIAGIDLGTTNSAIGIIEDGQPRIIPVDGRPTMPSCVGLDEAGGILVGQAAVNQLVAAPERTLTSIKSHMGSDLALKLGDRDYHPEELSAFILKRLKEVAENELGQPVKKAVITVPAYFDEKQRRATQNAAELAGLEAVRILNEPTAAALAYRLQGDEKQTVLVYDLGGGTFDVSLVNCEKDLVEVRASHGDTHLGGDNFDQALRAEIAKAWSGDEPLDLTDPRISRRLTIAAETAKCTLSDQPFAVVHEDFLAGDLHLEVEVARRDFEKLIEPMLEKTWESMNAALTDGEVTPDEVDKILLVGGSTRIPLVQAMIENQIGREASREVDPDLIVTLGAAIQGGIIAGLDVGSILVDISTQTFRTSAVDSASQELISIPLIQRGTPLPVTKSEVFSTQVDHQKQIFVEVSQGESFFPPENLEIGNFEVEGLARVPAGNIVLIEFALDLNGILTVTALEKATGLQKAVTIDTRDVGNSFDLGEARKRIVEAFGDDEVAEAEVVPKPSSTHPEVTRSKDLKARAKNLLTQNPDPEDQEELEDLLAQSLAAIKAGNHEGLVGISDQLEDIIFYLEE